jgi:hypothetical protein
MARVIGLFGFIMEEPGHDKRQARTLLQCEIAWERVCRFGERELKSNAVRETQMP